MVVPINALRSARRWARTCGGTLGGAVGAALGPGRVAAPPSRRCQSLTNAVAFEPSIPSFKMTENCAWFVIWRAPPPPKAEPTVTPTPTTRGSPRNAASTRLAILFVDASELPFGKRTSKRV